MVSRRAISKAIGFAVASLAVVLAFQNCGKMEALKVDQKTLESLIASGGGAPGGTTHVPGGTNPVNTGPQQYVYPAATPIKFKRVFSWSYGSYYCGIDQADSVKCWGDGRSLPVEPVPGIGPVKSMGLFSTKCALTLAGGVKCWGYVLGNGTRNSSLNAPVDVVGLTAGVKALYPGNRYFCAITANNTAACWGDIPSGEGLVASLAPSDPGFGPGVVGMHVADYHLCALYSSGEVRCMGSARGNGTGVARTFPATVPGVSAKSIDGNGNLLTTCVITTSDTVQCWGYFGGIIPTDGLQTIAGLSGVASLRVGAYGACALPLAPNGNIRCWSHNNFGRNFTTPISTTPSDFMPLAQAKDFAVGASTICYVTTTDTIKCVGDNQYGQLGSNREANSQYPITSVTLSNYKSIRTSLTFSCGLTSAGILRCWGNGSANIGAGAITAPARAPIDILTGVTDFAISDMHGCAVVTNGEIKCWGFNSLSSDEVGNLGTGALVYSVNMPTSVVGITGAKSVVVSNYANSCAVTANDTVKCWGSNAGGQLGNGVVLPAPGSGSVAAAALAPVDVVNVSNVASVVAGARHACALSKTGTVQCWGDYRYIGANAATSTATPVTLAGLTGIKQIVSAQFADCVVTANNTVKCWGINAKGLLGNGTTTNSLLPIDVPGLTDVATLSASSTHICATLLNGSVKCWGDNGFGQLGDQSTAAFSTVPVDFKYRQIGYDLIAGYGATYQVKLNGPLDITGRILFSSPAAGAEVQ